MGGWGWAGAGGSERTGRNPEERNAEIAGRQIPPPTKLVISPVLSAAGQSLLQLLGAARARAGAHTGPLLPVLAFDISLHTDPHAVELFPPSSLISLLTLSLTPSRSNPLA